MKRRVGSRLEVAEKYLHTPRHTPVGSGEKRRLVQPTPTTAKRDILRKQGRCILQQSNKMQLCAVNFISL